MIQCETLEEAAILARDASKNSPCLYYVTYTKKNGYRMESSNVRCRDAVQAWNKGKRWDKAAQGHNICGESFDLITEADKGSIK